MKAVYAEQLRRTLEAVQRRYDFSGREANDPVSWVKQFIHPQDQEVAAFIAATLAYGRVAQIKRTLSGLEPLIGLHPYKTLLSLTPLQIDRQLDKNLKHRLQSRQDLGCLLSLIGIALRTHGTLENMFLLGYKEGALRPSLDAFFDRLLDADTSPFAITPAVRFLFPQPRRKSACKRPLLFLRWMVGTTSNDLQLWKCVLPKDLLIPVDTHVLRISQNLGLTRRKTASWQAAEDITSKLRFLDDREPTRFDFALCHLGMSQECPSRFHKAICNCCQMNTLCRRYKRIQK